MEDSSIFDGNMIGDLDLEYMLDELPEVCAIDDLLGIDSPIVVDSSTVEASPNPSPGNVSSWIDEIHDYLMKDDDDQVALESSSAEFCDAFLAGVLVHSPANGSSEVVDTPNGGNSSACDDMVRLDAEAEKVATPKGGNSSGSHDNVSSEELEKEKLDIQVANGGGVEAADNPISKKQKRMLRNRDAAVRSRERKKTYVRDLEMKSKYLEGECRRLGRMLQYFVAENQALRFSLQKGSAFDATMTKQESAVLLLESLLLGSLLWFLAIICPLSLPSLLQSAVEAVTLGEGRTEGLRSLEPREARSKLFKHFAVPCYIQSRRCKASRTKMKASMLDI